MVDDLSLTLPQSFTIGDFYLIISSSYGPIRQLKRKKKSGKTFSLYWSNQKNSSFIWSGFYLTTLSKTKNVYVIVLSSIDGEEVHTLSKRRCNTVNFPAPVTSESPILPLWNSVPEA